MQLGPSEAGTASWMAKARNLGEAHGAISEIERDSLRRTLIELNSLFLEAPGEILNAYRSMAENRIAPSQARRTDIVMSGDLSWKLPNDEATSIAELLGGQIRAVDWMLARCASQWPFEPSEWFVEGHNHYVIPRTGLSKLRKAAGGQPYQKRGIFDHRILPAEVMGYAVNVIDSRTLRLSVGKRPLRKMAACLFSGFEAKPKFSEANDEKYFVVESVSCDAAESSVDQQIEESLVDNCLAVVWPELCVPPRLRKRIEEALAQGDLTDTRDRPAVVVAGSWHELKEKGYVNRSYIYDGYGVERITYDKIAPYYDPRWGKENIVPGREIAVMATEDALIGFAICLDFCDVNSNPFTELDIDLMLVPSMGNDDTMRGHQATAKRVEVRFGTRTFVVQQGTETEFNDGRIGAILPLLKKPDTIPLEKLGQNIVWKSYIWTATA
jgi:hypothetical protein